MNAFFEHHKDSILFRYRCFDRVLLNGLIPALPTTRARDRLFQYLPAGLPGEPRRAT